MRSVSERQLMRLLHGELRSDEARLLERQLEQDRDLRATYEQLTETWRLLEPPVRQSAVPAGFADSVVAAARKIHAGELSWALAPTWARAGAAMALVAGLTLGATFGGVEPAAQEIGLYAELEPLSLAEIYWISLEESDGQLSDAGAAEESPQ